MIEFETLASEAGSMLDQTNISAKDAEHFLVIRQWLRDIEQGRLVCVPASEFEARPDELLLVDRPDLAG